MCCFCLLNILQTLAQISNFKSPLRVPISWLICGATACVIAGVAGGGQGGGGSGRAHRTAGVTQPWSRFCTFCPLFQQEPGARCPTPRDRCTKGLLAACLPRVGCVGQPRLSLPPPAPSCPSPSAAQPGLAPSRWFGAPGVHACPLLRMGEGRGSSVCVVCTNK